MCANKTIFFHNLVGGVDLRKTNVVLALDGMIHDIGVRADAQSDYRETVVWMKERLERLRKRLLLEDRY